MAERTVPKHIRIYAGNYGIRWASALCGLARSVGPLVHEYPEIDATGMCDSVKGYLPGQPTISLGTINAILDPVQPNSMAGMYVGSISAGVYSFYIGEPTILQIAFGMRAEPVLGNPVFGGIFPLKDYMYSDDGGLVTINMGFGSAWDASLPTQFDRAWGQLLHPYGEETGANSSAGVDGGAASTNGGLMLLTILSSNAATATFKVQHSTDNSTFSDLTGASITVSGASTYNYYAIVPNGTTVNRYLRWQMSAGVTNTFVMSFIRG